MSNTFSWAPGTAWVGVFKLYAPPTRAFQVLSVIGIAFLCGRSFTHSHSATPALLEAPAPLLARQWKIMSHNGNAITANIGAFSSATMLWLALSEPASSPPVTSRLYVAAWVSAMLGGVWYRDERRSIVEKIEQRAVGYSEAVYTDANAEAEMAKEETTHYLVDRWAALGLERSALFGVSALLAGWASMGWSVKKIFRQGY